MNITQAKKVIPYIFSINRTPHLIGHAGIGKSSIVYQVCEELGYNVVEKRLGQMADAGDLIGLMEFIKDSKNNSNQYVDYVLPKWFPREPKTVIFLDEVNRAHKDLLQGIFELIYDKSLMGNRLPEDCHVIAASNPPTGDYQVLDFNDTAFQDRFVHIKLEPTVEEWLSFGKQRSFDEAVLSFILDNPKLLDNNTLEDFNLEFVKPSRRSWEAISRLRSSGIAEELFLETVMGIVGTHAAVTFNTYLSNRQRALSGADILNSYPKFKKDLQKNITEERRDKLASICDNVSEELKSMTSITKNQQDNLLAFITDLPDEYVLLLCQNIATYQSLFNAEGMSYGEFLNLDYWEQRLSKVHEAKKQAKERSEKEKK